MARPVTQLGSFIHTQNDYVTRHKSRRGIGFASGYLDLKVPIVYCLILSSFLVDDRTSKVMLLKEQCLHLLNLLYIRICFYGHLVCYSWP